MNDLVEGRWITVRTAANILGVCNQMIYKLLKKGKIKGMRIETAWRVEKESLLRYQRLSQTGGEEPGGVAGKVTDDKPKPGKGPMAKALEAVTRSIAERSVTGGI